jgi:hypothetical protein
VSQALLFPAKLALHGTQVPARQDLIKNFGVEVTLEDLNAVFPQVRRQGRQRQVWHHRLPMGRKQEQDLHRENRLPRIGICGVSQPIPEKVKGEHRYDHRHPGGKDPGRQGQGAQVLRLL